jgi:hypothetical protein
MSREDAYGNIKIWFENNRDSLLEIIEDIRNTDNYGSELKWLEKWITHYQQSFKELEFNQSFIYLNKLAGEYSGVDQYLLTRLLLDFLYNYPKIY